MNQRLFKVFTSVLLLLLTLNGCSKTSPESQGEIKEQGKASSTNDPNLIKIEFPVDTSVCDMFFGYQAIFASAYIDDKVMDPLSRLKESATTFQKEYVQDLFKMDTKNLSPDTIKFRDCSYFFELAELIDANEELKRKFSEDIENFDALEFVFDHIFYILMPSYDRVSHFLGTYTQKYHTTGPGLPSGLRLLTRPDYYDSKNHKGRSPEYLYIEMAPDYLQDELPPKTQIFQIGDTPVHDISYDESIYTLSKITDVNLMVKIFDPASETYGPLVPLEVSFQKLTKENVPQISYRKISDAPNIAYIQIPNFEKAGLDQELQNVWIKYLSEIKGSSDGVIFDLRSNRGGSLQEAHNILSMILPKKDMVTYHRLYRDSDTNKLQMQDYKTDDRFHISFGRIMVLSDFHSASSSEVFIEALKSYQAALHVGERTRGKAIGQVSAKIEKPHLKGTFSLTNFFLFDPSGNSWYQKGGSSQIEILERSNNPFYERFDAFASELPKPYKDKIDVSFNFDLTQIPHRVTPEVVDKLKNFYDSSAKPEECTDPLEEMPEEKSCILASGIMIMKQWIASELPAPKMDPKDLPPGMVPVPNASDLIQ